MKRAFAWLMVGAAGISFTGCARVHTKIVEKPRVDQELTQGQNKGYLKGSGPSTGSGRTTREMLETNVELPTWAEMNPWRKEKPEAAAPEATATPAPMPSYEPPSSSGWQQEQEEYNIPPISETPSSVSAPAGGTEYTVQKGDTLQKIAKKFYGSSKNWYRIYKANKGVLKSPDKIRPGQKITIPGAEGSSPEESSNEYK